MKKKFQQTAALCGVVILAGMYLLTLLAALFDHSAEQALLKASVTATILIPVMLYAMLLVARYLKGKGEDQTENK